MRTSLSNQIRGLLKTFGVVLGPGKGGSFDAAVMSGCPDDAILQDAIGALMAAWRVAGRTEKGPGPAVGALGPKHGGVSPHGDSPRRRRNHLSDVRHGH